MGVCLPSLLPSWNSPGAAGRAQNLKPKRPWLAQVGLIRPLHLRCSPNSQGSFLLLPGPWWAWGTPYTPFFRRPAALPVWEHFQSSLGQALWGSQKGTCCPPTPKLARLEKVHKCPFKMHVLKKKKKCMLCKEPRSKPVGICPIVC